MDNESRKMLPMYNIDDVRRRMRISNLEARLALHEIDVAALNRELKSPLTPTSRQQEAFKRRDFALTEAAQIKGELDEMRRLFPDLVHV